MRDWLKLAGREGAEKVGKAERIRMVRKEILVGKKEITDGKKQILVGKKEIMEGKRQILVGKKEIMEGKKEEKEGTITSRV